MFTRDLMSRSKGKEAWGEAARRERMMKGDRKNVTNVSC